MNSNDCVAYSEVYEIVKNLPEELANKIPSNLIEKINNRRNKNYQFIYDNEKTLSEQNISQKAKALLAVLFSEYIASAEERIELIKRFNQNEKNYQQKLSEEYDPSKIFERNKKELNSTSSKIGVASYSSVSSDIRKEGYLGDAKANEGRNLNKSAYDTNLLRKNKYGKHSRISDEIEIQEEGSNGVKIKADGKEIMLYKESFFTKLQKWFKNLLKK